MGPEEEQGPEGVKATEGLMGRVGGWKEWRRGDRFQGEFSGSTDLTWRHCGQEG